MEAASFKIKGLITILGCAGLFAALAVPLILRKVPRNIVYGYRTRFTLSDEYVWYEANAHFGRGMLLSSFATAACVFVLYRLPGLSPQSYMNLSIAAMVAPLAAAIVGTWRFTRTLTPRAPDHKFVP